MTAQRLALWLTGDRARSAKPLSPEAEALYREGLREQRHETNRIFSWLMPAQWVFAVILATWVSPLAWEGVKSSIHPHLWAALAGGGLIASAPILFICYRPDAAITGHIVAVAQMLFSALFIHLTGGRIETHFHVFGSLAILAFYLDRSLLFTASIVVVLDHLLRGWFVPQSVYGVASAGWWRSLEHGGWVLFEVVFLLSFTERTVRRTLRLAAEAAATQKALGDSEQRLRLVIDTAYDAYVAMNAEGRIVGWNEQAERIFGWKRSEVMGESFAEKIIPECSREAHRIGLERFLKMEDGPVLGQRLELSAIHRDGRELPIEITISAVKSGDTYLFNSFLRDITERREAARQRDELNRQLVDTSRQAGKAEVAVGVLHNVGNVLNSVNVSAGVINDTIRASQVRALSEVAQLLNSKNGSLAEYLSEDPRGRLVPELLEKLTEKIRAEHATLISEVESLVSHVGHIRETVALQQSHAKISGVTEKTTAQALVEDALKLEGSAMVRHGIDVVHEIRNVPPVIVDRHKVLQILVNLLRNAKQSLAGNGSRPKRLTIGITQPDDGAVLVSIRDNGMGIPRENLNRVFQHGFSTKGDNGHGFGLHISAIAAREIGGSLTVKSDGPGHGATFTLELPTAPNALTCTPTHRPPEKANSESPEAPTPAEVIPTASRCPFPGSTHS
jgi:PAS domain S-box-containing protein